MMQQSLFGADWVLAKDRLPLPGEWVLTISVTPSGEITRPSMSQPVGPDGLPVKHNGRLLYIPMAAWMPIPDLQARADEVRELAAQFKDKYQ